MKILSIDVGIKNLAICILETQDNNFNIIYWDVINLSEQKIYCCNCEIKYLKNKSTNKKNKNSKDDKDDKNIKQMNICGKQASFFKNDEYFCKTHANSCCYKLPTSNLTKFKNLKIDDLKKLCKDYEIDENGSKNKLISNIDEFIEKNILEPITKLKCNNINLIDIGKSIKNNLNKLDKNYIENLDYILIENQIGPIANRMNCIQGMLSQYFIMNNMENILYISAANKLKLFLANKKTSYNERKKLSIEITKKLLLENEININDKQEIVENFNKNKKKDDLSDCFLQGIWFLNEKNDKYIKKLIMLVNENIYINS